MNKEDMIMILMALSKLEGYVLGKTGTHIPEDLAEEVLLAAETLAKHINDDAEHRAQIDAMPSMARLQGVVQS